MEIADFLMDWGGLIFRSAWAGLAALGIWRSRLNWNLVKSAQTKMVEAQLDGVQTARALYYKRDIGLLAGALTSSGLAALTSIWGIPLLPLVCLCVEHALLVMLAFNFAAGWQRLNQLILEERIRQRIQHRPSSLPMEEGHA